MLIFPPYKLIKMYKSFSKWLKTKMISSKWLKQKGLNFHVSYQNKRKTDNIGTQYSKNDMTLKYI